MARNKSFDFTIKINDIDYTEYCSIKSLKINKNLDHTQVYSPVTINITNVIGLAYNIEKNDYATIQINSDLLYFQVSNIKRKQSNTEIRLVNVFELLKDKTFLIIDENNNKYINPILEPFLDSVDDQKLDNPNFTDLLEMIISLAIGTSQKGKLRYDNFVVKTYNPVTESLTDSTGTAYFTFVTLNEDYLDWMDNTSPSQLLEDLQKIFCFNIQGQYSNGYFQYKSLPLLKVNSDWELFRNQYRDFDYFSLETVINDLNPLRQLDKDYYIDTDEFLNKKKKPLKVFDIIDVGGEDVEQIYFEYLYRNNLSVEEIELPRNLDLRINNQVEVFQPLQFQLAEGKYILKKGSYSCFLRHFSNDDIIQDSVTKLDYQEVTGYNKKSYLFTNEDNQDDFVDYKECRDLTWNNENYSVNLNINIPVLKNSIRG